MTFEQAFQALQDTVTQLETGELALEETLALYERGQALARRCQDLLDQAELRVTELDDTLGDSL
jgi:exodeoxyribonuclease VII small subunit